MLILSTSEEVHAHEDQVRVLYASHSIEDQMVGILMDGCVGGAGEIEQVARAKVHALLERFDQRAPAPQIPVAAASAWRSPDAGRHSQGVPSI